MLNEILKNKQIILASGSPRRQEFFKDLHIPFVIDVRPVTEVYPKHLKGTEITDYLAKLKADAFKDLTNDQILITSDTIVSNDGIAMGKPKNTSEAKQMIASLSGKTHSVETSVCFTTAKDQKVVHSSTKVTFKKLSEEEIRERMSGNICRCGAYNNIVQAFKEVHSGDSEMPTWEFATEAQVQKAKNS